MKEKKLEPSRFRKHFWTWHGCITPVGFMSLAQGGFPSKPVTTGSVISV